LQLALKIIEQGETERYEPEQYEDKKKKRVLQRSTPRSRASRL